jgi:hypothetical protein
MKNLFYMLIFIGTFFFSCQKQDPPVVHAATPDEHYQKIDQLVTGVQMFGDADQDQPLIFTESDYRLICRTEDNHLNIWSDEDIRMVLGNSQMTYADKLRFLREKIPASQRSVEGETLETVALRNGRAPIFDSNPDIVAQTLAASGSIVGVQSSLNFWRPSFPSDNGAVTTFDITRSMIASSQQSFLDNAVEYDPNSVVWDFEVSGGNWLIGATIVVYNSAGIPTEYVYGMNSPLGPLVWNPTLDSPASDDVIQGPLPNGVVSISANGLTPPPPSF